MDTMGISQTREMIRSNVDHEKYNVLFFGVDPNKTTGPERYCMSLMMLTREFASNAKRIRVTVEIIE